MAVGGVREGAPASSREAPRRGQGGRVGHAGSSGWLPYALLALPALVYGTFVVFPLASTVRVSFYDWNGLTPPVFVGLGNYVALMGDTLFWGALVHNGVFLLFYTVLPVGVAFLLVVLLTQERAVRGLALYRVGLFVPQVIPMVVVGVVWRWMYSPINGVVNVALGWFGADPRPFLGDVTTALPAVGLVATWVQYGFAMVLFLAGIQRIDRALFDAAAVDGAGPWARFRHITLPGLRGEIVVALTVSMIAAFRVFDLVFVMTRGGPANATNVVAFEIWRRAFQQREVGAAAAVATVLVVLILALSRLVLRLQESEQ
ncbi:MAG: sugar ABC transporter permease [Euzebyales bacterium]|nr:sugar ABC transporter permease [Euzebyales bacterium]